MSFWLLAICGCTVGAAAQPETIPLWPQGAPESVAAPGYRESVEYWNNDRSSPIAKRVSTAALEVFRPEKPSPLGAVILICPGGGYYSLNFQKEGRDVAQWLNSLGVTAIVVRYRLPSAEIMKRPWIGPLQDIQEAVRNVRRHAKEWEINEARVGVCGFSAGGHVAALASTLYAENTYTSDDKTSARPDFTILVYPLVSMSPEIASRGLTHDLLGEAPPPERVKELSAELHVSSKTPPAFLVHAKDDAAVSPEHSVRYDRALREHGVPSELHLYPKGNHGFGLGLFPDSPKQWTAELKAWMEAQGYL